MLVGLGFCCGHFSRPGDLVAMAADGQQRSALRSDGMDGVVDAADLANY